MTAIQTMQHELDKIGVAMSECVTEEGVVKTSCRYRFQMLLRQAESFRESIKWLEEQVYA